MTGDVSDIQARLRALLPPWWPNVGQAPVFDAILIGIATTCSYIYALIVYAREQTRIRSANGAWLDLIAWDYFGSRFTRIPGEADPAFDVRIVKELVRPRTTRDAIYNALLELTGYPPRITEGWLPSDVGVRGRMYRGVDVYPSSPGRLADPGLANQIFIETVLPTVPIFGNNAMPARGVNKYRGLPPTGYRMDVPTTTPLGPQVVYDLINSIKAAGTTVWVKFVPIPTAVTWDQPNVTWDQSGVAWDQLAPPST